MSLNDYVDAVADIIERASERAATLYASEEGAVLDASGEELLQFTPVELAAALDALGLIEDDVQAEGNAIDPPEVLEELHHLLMDDTFTRARRALAARSANAEDWIELSASAEMEAYRAAVARDKELCLEIQEMLDSTQVREAFEETPWFQAELAEVVDSALGCAVWPDDPSTLFRPPGG